MVNGSHGHGRVRVRVQPDGPPPALASNVDAVALAVGDEVVPNYVDADSQAEHVPGVILSIEESSARVRWEPGDRTETLPIEHLIKR